MKGLMYHKCVKNTTSRKCTFCGSSIPKGNTIEILSSTRTYGLNIIDTYPYWVFCEGHLSKWINQQQREFLLKKI